MDFDRPVVLPEDLPYIMRSYPFGEVLNCEYLGGVPNVTYKVVTSQKVLALRVSNRGYSSSEHIAIEMQLLDHLTRVGFDKSPRLVRGLDGRILQRWKEYWVCATEFIPGDLVDAVEITPGLCRDVGRAVASLQDAMASFKPDVLLEGETFMSRGAKLLEALPLALQMRGWSMDISNVLSQWERVTTAFIRNAPRLSWHIIHADVWPPNVICREERVVGIIDFDDWCYGPTILDVCASLVEFPMYRTVIMREDLAVALLHGFLLGGGHISELEAELIVDGMEMACAMWLACNVIQNPDFEESIIYLRKLNALHDLGSREQFCADIQRYLRIASSFIPETDTDSSK